MLAIDRSQVGANFGKVDAVDGLGGFEFDYHLVFDKQIKLMVARLEVLIENLDRMLATDLQSTSRQLVAQGLLINRLDESRPQRSVHLDGASDDAFRQRSMFQWHL